MDVVVRALVYIITKENLIMATIEDLKAAVTAEAAEVKSRIDELEATVQTLRDQIAAGGTITEAQLDEVLVAIQGIFTPTA
jgi:translation initiation factor 1 (eIF-1/SUI1)